MGPGLIGGVPSVGIFLRDPNPYLCEYHGELRTARSTSVTVIWTWHLPSTSFKRSASSSTGGAIPESAKSVLFYEELNAKFFKYFE